MACRVCERCAASAAPPRCRLDWAAPGSGTESAAPIALALRSLLVAGVSMTASVTPLCLSANNARSISKPLPARSIRGSGSVRRRLQLETVPCGSVSMMATRCPSPIAATASPMASVLLPLPPFWVANTITRIMRCLSWQTAQHNEKMELTINHWGNVCEFESRQMAAIHRRSPALFSAADHRQPPPPFT